VTAIIPQHPTPRIVSAIGVTNSSDQDARATALAICGDQLAAVGGDDRTRDGEAHAHPFALGRKAIKGYKLTRQEIRGLVSNPLSEDTDLLK
jgi:hypothetical protein